MVVSGGTRGMWSSCRNIHRTVVLKQTQRLGQCLPARWPCAPWPWCAGPGAVGAAGAVGAPGVEGPTLGAAALVTGAVTLLVTACVPVYGVVGLGAAPGVAGWLLVCPAARSAADTRSSSAVAMATAGDAITTPYTRDALTALHRCTH